MKNKNVTDSDALSELAKKVESPLTVGHKVVVITTTLYYIGLVTQTHDDHVVLANAGILTEVESLSEMFAGTRPLNPECVEMLAEDGACYLNRYSIITCFDWHAKLPAPGPRKK